MAKIIIVNEKDEPIGLKERGTVDSKKDIVRVSALWVTNSKNQVLLAQRKMNKKHNPGKWGPAVGGTVEEGETYESNIYKEAEEEIGLTGYKFAEGPKIVVDNPNRKFSQIYFLTLDREINQFKIQKEEVEQIKWFDKDELLRKLKENPNNYTPGVHRLIRIDRKK